MQETRPPKDKYEFHWLWAERADTPIVSQWLAGNWFSSGEASPISPEEMYRRGWRYLKPAKPPKLPFD